MTTPVQTYANHTRSIPIYHRFALPVLVINLVVTIVALVRHPAVASAWNVVVAAAIAIGILWGRVQALTAQDRVIRLEETLRLREVLPPERHEEIGRLSRYQFVSLRFAPDEELPALVSRVLAGEFAKPADIKKAIRQWRPDHLRV